MRKYLKNRYQIMCFLLSMAIFVFLSLLAMILGYLKAALLILLTVLSITILCCAFGFYLIFQFVSFDKKGIHVSFFKKELNLIKWEDVTTIAESYVYRGPVLRITYNNGKTLNLDRRKCIKKELDKYIKQNWIIIIHRRNSS